MSRRLDQIPIAIDQLVNTICGCVPVYINFDGMDGADIMAREFVPDCLIEIVSDVWDFIADCVGFEGGWKISRIRKNKHFTGEAQ